MKIAVPCRQRRLLVLCAASAALHLALLELVARHGGAGPVALPAADPLVLRLAPAASPAAALPATPTPGAPPARPRSVAAARTAASPPRRPAAARAVPLATARPDTGIAPAQAAVAETAPEPALPGRYRVRLPDSVRLDYIRTLQRPGSVAVAAAPASIAWQTDGRHYALRVDGVVGRLSSDGEHGDVGLLPRSAVDDGAGSDGDHAARTTVFDHAAGIVRFDGGAADAPAAIGIQDRASLLLQLAGIGLGAPRQVGGTIAVVVAGAQAATVVRFEVMGEEDVATGLGTFRAWHLAEIAAPGQPRLEAWLAPDQDWLPVRLSMTAGDGSVAVQTLAAATRAPAP